MSVNGQTLVNHKPMRTGDEHAATRMQLWPAWPHSRIKYQLTRIVDRVDCRVICDDWFSAGWENHAANSVVLISLWQRRTHERQCGFQRKCALHALTRIEYCARHSQRRRQKEMSDGPMAAQPERRIIIHKYLIMSQRAFRYIVYCPNECPAFRCVSMWCIRSNRERAGHLRWIIATWIFYCNTKIRHS